MGWGIYSDNKIPDNDVFWQRYGDIPEKYASFLYLRVFWSDMEPEEGKYIWEYDDNFKDLIATAAEKGLKLCFRVFYDSQDSRRQVTPDYVRQAGAEGYLSNCGCWSPYPDDPVFLEKLQKFLYAFADRFDDPSIVDVIDAYNLGWWGEGHHVKLKNPDALRSVSLAVAGAYANAFDKVLLAINYHVEITEPVLLEIINKYDFILRHDAFGSQWYGTFEKGFADKYGFPARPVIAESCYWFVGQDKGQNVSESGLDDTERWRNDERIKGMESWRDCYLATYSDAEKAHANTLDLREYREARSWVSEAPDLVQAFVLNGGYRFTPVRIRYPRMFKKGSEISIIHEWVNNGFGMLPSSNSRWGDKYHPAFALMDSQGEIVSILGCDEHVHPSDWVKGTSYMCESNFIAADCPPGKYKLAVAILDVNTSKPGINLSVDGVTVVDGWTILGNCRVLR